MDPEAQIMSTGIEGLDEVLLGGIERRRTYLVEGRPGAGKTTLALEWLLDGVAQGERCLHVTLSETVDELQASIRSHGWREGHENLAVFALDVAQRDTQYTMYHPAEVELHETIERILAEVERVDPHRVVIDSLSEVRLLSQDPLRFRHQILALKQFLVDRGCTALLISQELAEPHQAGLHSLVHGVIHLSQTTVDFGATRRQLQVVKMRGRAYQEGVHSFTIRRGGIRVFCRLDGGSADFEHVALGTGSEGFDRLLGGGLPGGAGTLFLGPTGTGKSTVMAQCVAAALQRGQRAVVFTFDERRALFLDRAEGVGLGLHAHAEAGRLSVQQVDPGQHSPGEFAHRVRTAVEADGCELVAIDSLNGFLSSMPEERFLLIHLHELLGYLGGKAVTSILTMTQPGTFGAGGHTSVDASYLADAMVLFRYFEAHGEVRKALSVLKKRIGGHEKSVRELRIGSEGVEVGEPLAGFRGILAGMPDLHYGARLAPGEVEGDGG